MPDTYHTAGIGGDRHLNFYSNRDNLRAHLEQVLRVYVDHYNVHRPHRALRLESPGPPAGPSVISENRRPVSRRDRPGGLLHEYHRQAS